jgi:RNA-splicing ligase RtcB
MQNINMQKNNIFKQNNNNIVIMSYQSFQFYLNKSCSLENLSFKNKQIFEQNTKHSFFDRIDRISLELSRISLRLNQSVSTSNLSEIEQLEKEHKNLTMINLQEARQALPTCSNEEDYERFIEVADRFTDTFISVAAQKDFITIILAKLEGKAQKNINYY